MNVLSSLPAVHLAPQRPNMCLQEQLHYAPVSVTTHKSPWSWATIYNTNTYAQRHTLTNTHTHTHSSSSTATKQQLWRRGRRWLDSNREERKSLGQLFVSSGTIRGAKKQIAAHDLIIRYRAWALNYLTEIGLSLGPSGLIEQERWGR